MNGYLLLIQRQLPYPLLLIAEQELRIIQARGGPEPLSIEAFESPPSLVDAVEADHDLARQDPCKQQANGSSEFCGISG